MMIILLKRIIYAQMPYHCNEILIDAQVNFRKVDDTEILYNLTTPATTSIKNLKNMKYKHS